MEATTATPDTATRGEPHARARARGADEPRPRPRSADHRLLARPERRVIVTAGGLWMSRVYLQSAFLEVGAALLLAAPLILVERLVDQRLKTVETGVQNVAEKVNRTQTKIDELGQETRSRIAAARQSDTELLEELETSPSERTVWNALQRAQEFAAVDHDGVRVRIPDASLRIRFNVTPGDAMTAGPVEISVEDSERAAGRRIRVLVGRRVGRGGARRPRPGSTTESRVSGERALRRHEDLHRAWPTRSRRSSACSPTSGRAARSVRWWSSTTVGADVPRPRARERRDAPRAQAAAPRRRGGRPQRPRS